MRELAIGANRKDGDGVVEAIGAVDKFAVARHQDFRAKISARKAGRQRGDGLARGERSGCRIVCKECDGRGFFLDRVEPTAVGMEGEVARAVAGGKFDEGRLGWSQLSRA